jgi:hypothetical protein
MNFVKGCSIEGIAFCNLSFHHSSPSLIVMCQHSFHKSHDFSTTAGSTEVLILHRIVLYRVQVIMI